MDALEQITLSSQVFGRALAAAFGRPLAIVGLTAFAVPALAAAAMVNFAHPLLSPVMLPLVFALGGEWAVHYPGAIVELPAMLAALGGGSGWLTLPLLLGWAGTLATYGRGGVSAGATLLTTLQRLPRMLLIGAPLAFAHGMAASASAAALAELSHRLIRSMVHLVAAGAAEAAVLTAGAWLLPLAVRTDLPLGAIPAALKRAFRWGGMALPSLGLAMSAVALAGRITCVKLAEDLAANRPDLLLFVTLAAALLTAVGIVVFASASVIMASALDEGWQ